MKTIYERCFLIKQRIEEQEFKHWDAARNGCTIASVIEIEETIKHLHDQMAVLQQLQKQITDANSTCSIA